MKKKTSLKVAWLCCVTLCFVCVCVCINVCLWAEVQRAALGSASATLLISKWNQLQTTLNIHSFQHCKTFAWNRFFLILFIVLKIKKKSKTKVKVLIQNKLCVYKYLVYIQGINMLLCSLFTQDFSPYVGETYEVGTGLHVLWPFATRGPSKNWLPVSGMCTLARREIFSWSPGFFLVL